MPIAARSVHGSSKPLRRKSSKPTRSQPSRSNKAPNQRAESNCRGSK
jgi:hypothetical protein